MEDKTVKSEIRFGVLLHFYQPPYQTDDMVKLISKQCYLPVSRWLAEGHFPAVVNINYSLLEHLQRLGLDEIITNLGVAAEKGNIEFTGSAAYHAILPVLLSYDKGKSEVKRQIELNHKLSEKLLGKAWNAKGFFPPEMAFSPEVAEIVRDMGYYKWTVTDASLYDATNPGTSIPYKEVSTVRDLPVFFRSNGWSNHFTQKMPEEKDYNVVKFFDKMSKGINSWFNGTMGHYELAFDGETISHHVTEYGVHTLDAFAQESARVGFKPMLFTDILQQFPRKEVTIKPGSWSTMEIDYKEGEYFPRWRHTRNEIHMVLSKLTNLSIGVVNFASELCHENAEAKEYYSKSRSILDNAETSCPLWWANRLHDKGSKFHIKSGRDLLISTIQRGIEAIEKSDSYVNLRVNEVIGSVQQLKSKVELLNIRLEELVSC